MKECGVYCIENLINGKRYIGSSNDLRKRYLTHFEELKRKCHSNQHLQAAFNKYGKQCFKFTILCLCAKTLLLIKEQEYLDELKTYKKSIGYNLYSKAGSPQGCIVKKETREKLSVLAKRYWNTKEGRAKNAAKWRGRNHTPESRKKMSDKRKEFLSDKIERQRLAINTTMSWRTGKMDLVSSKVRELWKDKGYRSKNLLGQKNHPPNKEVLSEATQKNWLNPEIKQKMIDGMYRASSRKSKGLKDYWKIKRIATAAVCIVLLISTNIFASPIKYEMFFKRWSNFYFPWEDHKWFVAQGIAESNLRPEVVSWAGAAGIMQLMPATAKELGVTNRFDPEESIQGGVKYDRTVDRFFKEVPYPERRKFVFGGYNAGMGNIRKAKVLANSDFWEDLVDYLPKVTGRHANETIGYVSRIYRLKEVLW